MERPSQVLGIDLNNLLVVFAFTISSAMLIGFLGMVIDIHWSVYILVLVISIGLFFFFKYLAKHRPPGFAMGFMSYYLRQPKRLSIGLPSKKNGKK